MDSELALRRDLDFLRHNMNSRRRDRSFIKGLESDYGELISDLFHMQVCLNAVAPQLCWCSVFIDDRARAS